MVDSQIIRCPICGSYRHKTHFHVGHRGCDTCWEQGRLWEGATDKLHQKLGEDQRRHVSAIIYDWLVQDDLPADINADERKLLLLCGIEQQSLTESAKTIGVSEKRAASIEERAQRKLRRLAIAAIPEWVAARN